MDCSKIIILDGATGTELMKKGFNGKNQPEWILTHRSDMEELQDDYVAAGTTLIYTPTFTANREKLRIMGCEDRLEEYNTGLAEIAKKSGVQVFGDIGPTGLFTKPLGKTTPEELFDIYLEQAKALDKGGVDGFAVETMMTLDDTLAAVKAVKSFSDKPVIVSCTCDKRGHLMTGTSIIEVLEKTQELGIDAFGLNCSVGPEDLLTQIKRLHEATDLPLLAKPNAGLPVYRGGKTVYDCSPEKFASFVPEFIENGVRLIGGCCGTSPEYIRQIKKAINAME